MQYVQAYLQASWQAPQRWVRLCGLPVGMHRWGARGLGEREGRRSLQRRGQVGPDPGRRGAGG